MFALRRINLINAFVKSFPQTNRDFNSLFNVKKMVVFIKLLLVNFRINFFQRVLPKIFLQLKMEKSLKKRL